MGFASSPPGMVCMAKPCCHAIALNLKQTQRRKVLVTWSFNFEVGVGYGMIDMNRFCWYSDRVAT